AGPADFHAHLRQKSLCELVTPHPNLTPPITTTDQALAYKAELERIEPNVQFLMTLYLSRELTPQEIMKAKQAGIVVLEHATTREAVDTVKRLGSTVACTITAHHLALTVDDWAGQSFNFCKPVAKYPDDREALRAVVKE
ncbi:13017_t:CDS:2, partial [Acaulospora colombiana]